MRAFFVQNLISSSIQDLLKEQENLTQEVFDMMYYGNMSYIDIYLMPIDFRNKILKLLIKTKREEKNKPVT